MRNMGTRAYARQARTGPAPRDQVRCPVQKEFTEPVALLSTQPDDLPLPRTASGLSFDLLALRARCMEEAMGGSRLGQGLDSWD